MINKSVVKYIQSLQHKKFRDEHNSFIAEGPKVVEEFLTNNIFECEQIYCTKNALANLNTKLKTTFENKITVIQDFELDKISAFATPNNIVAVFTKKSTPSSINISKKITLFLDDIQDPGNLGTIIRTADWFGIETIFCSNNTADCYNPKVVQSTMASLGRVNVCYGNIEYELAKHSNILKYAAVLGGKSVKEVGIIKEGIIIIGNESKGVSTNVLAMVNEKITISKIGTAESLNAAVAAGIILFAVI